MTGALTSSLSAVCDPGCTLSLLELGAPLHRWVALVLVMRMMGAPSPHEPVQLLVLVVVLVVVVDEGEEAVLLPVVPFTLQPPPVGVEGVVARLPLPYATLQPNHGGVCLP